MILSRVGVINNIGNYGRRLAPPHHTVDRVKKGGGHGPQHVVGRETLVVMGQIIMCVFRRGVKTTWMMITKVANYKRRVTRLFIIAFLVNVSKTAKL